MYDTMPTHHRHQRLVPWGVVICKHMIVMPNNRQMKYMVHPITISLGDSQMKTNLQHGRLPLSHINPNTCWPWHLIALSVMIYSI